MIEHTLYTAKIDFAIYLTFWDLSIMDIVKKIVILGWKILWTQDNDWFIA